MRSRGLVPPLLLATFLAACSGTGTGREAAPVDRPHATEVVVEWNRLLLEVAETEDRFLTLKGVRAAAMMHLAVHDALNAVQRRFEPYRLRDSVPGVHPVDAANEAAYAVAAAQYPDRVDVFDEERARWRSGEASAPDPSARSLGERAAAAVLGAREGDGWDRDPGYRWHPMAPGVYAEFREHSGTPEGFVFGAGWAEAVPFVLESPSQFRSPPPPAIGSDTYTRAFAEVKEAGGRNSVTRTADQTHRAMWWKEFVESSHNRLTRELVSERGLGPWEAARLFALLNMSIFDGYVASFDGKFHYNHWRPYTAIRWASNDGNPDTEEDPDWTNLHDHTYAFPSYPSAHGTVCAAAMAVLGSVFGEGVPFTMTIPEVDSQGPSSPRIPTDPPTRSFESFTEAAVECSESRIYLGIHFRYDSEAGTELGRRVGALATRELLRPAGR